MSITNNSNGESRNALNTADAAKYLGLAKVTLCIYRQRGGGPAYVKIGKAVRYLKTDLDQFLNSRRIAR